MASLRPSRFLLQWVTISVVDQPWRTSHISFIFNFIHRIVENSCIAVRVDKLLIHFSTSVPESFGNESPLELQVMKTPMRTTLVLIDITHATADLGVITFVLIRQQYINGLPSSKSHGCIVIAYAWLRSPIRRSPSPASEFATCPSQLALRRAWFFMMSLGRRSFWLSLRRQCGRNDFLVVFVYFWINACTATVGTALGCVDEVIEIICLYTLSEAVVKSLSLMQNQIASFSTFLVVCWNTERYTVQKFVCDEFHPPPLHTSEISLLKIMTKRVFVPQSSFWSGFSVSAHDFSDGTNVVGSD